mgnify:CR=1 FL=1
MPSIRLVLLASAFVLAACGGGGPRGPGGPGGPGGRGLSPAAAEMNAAVTCRIKSYAGADGAVARTALDAGLRAEFAAADISGDGGLQKDEIAALNAARSQRCDSEPLIDWEGAGRMTYTAYAARIFTLFDRADANADGVLDPAEMQAAGMPRRGIAPPRSSSAGPG